MHTFTVIMESTKRTILQEVNTADRFLSRLLGLMGRRHLPQGHALWLPRTDSIHTCFMRFPIDVIYLDSRQRVKKIVSAMKPWRLSWCAGADSVLEAPAGWAEAVGLRKGEKLRFLPKQA